MTFYERAERLVDWAVEYDDEINVGFSWPAVISLTIGGSYFFVQSLDISTIYAFMTFVLSFW